jgi:hypothetical protein
LFPLGKDLELINIEAEVDRKLLLNILSDGIDWSCAEGYWGQVHKYKWYWWYVVDENGEPDTDKINPDLTGDTSLIQIRDDADGEADEEDRPWTDITLNNLEEAFGWAFRNYNHLFGSIQVDKGTIIDCDYDALSADVILQRIVLGEVVYG